jgi:hypothetical protein
MGEVEFIQPIVEFLVRDREDAVAHAREITQKLNALNMGKAGEVKFTASGMDKVEGAVTSIKQKLSQLAQGGDLTRMLSSSIEQAFREAGAGAGEALAGGIGGTVGSVLAGAIGGVIASAIPGLGAGLKQMADESEQEGQMAARAPTPEEAERWDKVRARGYSNWVMAKYGPDTFNSMMGKFQRAGMSPEDAEKEGNQLMTVGQNTGVDPDSLAQDVINVKTRGSGRAGAALIHAVPEFEKKLRQMMNEAGGNYGQGDEESARLEDDVRSKRISSKTVLEAVRRSAIDPEMVRGAEAANNPNSWAGVFRDLFRGGQHMFSHPIEALTPGAEPHTNTLGLPGMEQGSTGPWQNTSEAIRGQYAFTSLSGLAEKMQQEASGGGDVQEQQLNVLQEIRDKLPGTPDKPHPGGEQSGAHTHPAT